jgi:hypothetical protein
MPVFRRAGSFFALFLVMTMPLSQFSRFAIARTLRDYVQLAERVRVLTNADFNYCGVEISYLIHDLGGMAGEW